MRYNPLKLNCGTVCELNAMTQSQSCMDQRGGARPGSGRPKGSVQKITAKAREEAAQSGLLPHAWLLAVARGEPVSHKRWKITYDKNGNETKRQLVTEDFYADFPMRIDAAKAAAPYYSPRLAVQTVTVDGNLGLTKLSDEELKAELLTLIKEMPELLTMIPNKPGTKKK